MWKWTATAAIVLALSLPARAEYTVKGSVECTDIVKEDTHQHHREYNKWWLLGYITARNFMADKTGGNGKVARGVDADAIYAMALAFCQGNAEADWDDAAVHVYDLLE